MRTICQNDAHANTPCAITLNRTIECEIFVVDVERARKSTSSLEQRRPGFRQNRREERREERKEGREERWQDGCSFSEELLRVAYVTAISFIPRFIFLAPCYIPPILRPSSLTVQPSSPGCFSTEGQRVSRGVPTHRTSTFKVDPRKFREEFFFHIHWGVIIRCNLTNFYPSPSR